MARPNNNEILFVNVRATSMRIQRVYIMRYLKQGSQERENYTTLLRSNSHHYSILRFVIYAHRLHLLLKILTDLHAALVTIVAQSDEIRIARANQLSPTNCVTAHRWYERGEGEGG